MHQIFLLVGTGANHHPFFEDNAILKLERCVIIHAKINSKNSYMGKLIFPQLRDDSNASKILLFYLNQQFRKQQKLKFGKA